MKTRTPFRGLAFGCIALFSLTLGCQQPPGFRRISTGYTTGHPDFHESDNKFSFVRGVFPNKTSLVLVNQNGRRLGRYRFHGYSLSGHQVVLPSGQRAVVAATHLRDYSAAPVIALVDLSSGKKIREELLPEGSSVLSIEKPDWSQEVFILTSHEGNMLLQRMDPISGQTLDPEILGRYQGVEGPLWHRGRVMRALDLEPAFSDRFPILLVQAEAQDGNDVVAYDIQEHRELATFPSDTEVSQLQEGEDHGVFYGLSQKPGQNKGLLTRFSVDTKQSEVLFEFDGVPETFWEVHGTFYVIVRDMSRPEEQSKYYLHPRTIYVFQRGQSTPDSIGPWTSRNGRFIGYSADRQELYFAVIDLDDPAIWGIREDIRTLSRVHQVIR